MATADELIGHLDDVRARTLSLYEPLSDRDIIRTPDSIMSPPVWDLGHIAAYEELWVACTLDGQDPLHPDLQAAYDAFETPRAERTQIALLSRGDCHDYLDRVRRRTIDVLGRADRTSGPPLARDGFVFDLVAQHEAQHTETVLQTLQMFTGGEYTPPRRDVPGQDDRPLGPVTLAGGSTMIGTDSRSFSYDNERPAHQVHVDPFTIARAPVTNREFIDFIDDSGYARPELWTPSGWDWCRQTEAQAPAYWIVDDGEYLTRSFDRVEPIGHDHPVCHVSFWEADAYARWAGARLPTEYEWEFAAAGATTTDAHLDQTWFHTAPVGAAAGGASDCGCVDMLGNVWEWTSSRFRPYPGFRVDPYPEYSQVFFDGEYYVLRGGSWATQTDAVRPTFRNWDRPQRRQIFSGLRLAWDVV